MPDLGRISRIPCRIRHFRLKIISLFLHHFVKKTYLGKVTKAFMYLPIGNGTTDERSLWGVILPPGYPGRVNADILSASDNKHWTCNEFIQINSRIITFMLRQELISSYTYLPAASMATEHETVQSKWFLDSFDPWQQDMQLLAELFFVKNQGILDNPVLNNHTQLCPPNQTAFSNITLKLHYNKIVVE